MCIVGGEVLSQNREIYGKEKKNERKEKRGKLHSVFSSKKITSISKKKF